MEIKVDGHIVLVDQEEFERLGSPRLAVYADGRGGVQAVRILGQAKTVYLHKEIFGPIPEGYVVDHKDRNVLNNLKSNFRLATTAQNNQNNDQGKYNRSGFKGVSWYSKYAMWRAAISIDGKKKHLGYFNSKEDAALAYAKAAIKHYGEFAPQYVRDLVESKTN